MEKYFVTYQPQKVAEELKIRDYVVINSDYYHIKNEFGYNPIFFIPLDNKLDFLIKNFFSTPSKPEVMIITKLDKYDCIDAAKWYELKGKEKIHKSIKSNSSDETEKEYISEKIIKNNVAKIIKVNEMISNLQNIDDVCRTKMLMWFQKFWDELEGYFQSSDERDMCKFVSSEQFNKVIIEFDEIMNHHNLGQAGNMKWFRDKLTEISKNFDWF